MHAPPSIAVRAQRHRWRPPGRGAGLRLASRARSGWPEPILLAMGVGYRLLVGAVLVSRLAGLGHAGVLLASWVGRQTEAGDATFGGRAGRVVAFAMGSAGPRRRSSRAAGVVAVAV